MADVLTPEQRSYNMSRIHGKDTKPEEMVRKYLFSQGFRYRYIVYIVCPYDFVSSLDQTEIKAASPTKQG